MNLKRLALLICCTAVATLAFVVLNFWSERNGPAFRKFEQQWREDVALLEESNKLPRQWHDIKEIEVIGGTPETKRWLRQIEIPLKTNPNGTHRMDVLVVAWEEEGVRGVIVQYNIEQLPSKNNIWELGRTIILRQPGNLLEDFSL